MWWKIKLSAWNTVKWAAKAIAPILKQSAAMALEKKINERIDKL